AVPSSISIGDADPASKAAGAVLGNGAALGRLRIVKQLGSGAMGVVYLAQDPVLGRNVALKELSGALARTPEAHERLLREARALAQISSPYVVQIYDVYEQAGRRLLCMEVCEGPDLASLLAARGPLPPLEAAGLGAPIAD